MAAKGRIPFGFVWLFLNYAKAKSQVGELSGVFHHICGNLGWKLLEIVIFRS